MQAGARPGRGAPPPPRGLLCMVVLAAAPLLAQPAAGASGGRHVPTLYTVASGVEFVNTADDRARGAVNNPFDEPTNRLRPNAPEVGSGPFPGDVAVYSF